MAVDYVAFIRKAGVPAVRRYVEAIGIDLSEVGEDSDPAFVLATLERVARNDNRVWAVFQDCEAFGPREARVALRSVLVRESELLVTFDAMTESNRECALWLAAARPKLFENAVSWLNTWPRLKGRSWDGYKIVTPDDQALTIDLGPEAIASFEVLTRPALDAYKAATFSGKIKAAPFERLLSSSVSHSQRTVTQVTIYAEGPHESHDKISEAHEIHTELLRPINEGAVIYDPMPRTLEVVVLGGARARRKVADAFCEAFLPANVQLIRLISRDIDFQKFAREPVFPLKASDPVEHVAIDEIRYSLPDSGGALITLEKPYSAKHRTSIFADARDWPEVCPPENMSSWEVVAVRLRFLFKSDGQSSKQRVRTVELKAPRSTTLREKSDSDHAIMNELLERWAVFKEDPDDPVDGDQ